MTAPEPSGCAITGDARTAAALLAADPPEITRAREALSKAHNGGQSHVTLDLPTADDLMGAVDYLKQRLARTREALAAAEDGARDSLWAAERVTNERDACLGEIRSARALCARSPLCISRPPGGEG